MANTISRQSNPLSVVSGASTIVEVLVARAAVHGNDLAYAFLDDQGEITARLTYAELNQRACVIAAALSRHVGMQERVVLAFSSGLELLEAFFGCLYAGAIAVLIHPGTRHVAGERFSHVLDDADPVAVLASPSARAAAMRTAGGLGTRRWFTLDDFRSSSSGVETSSQPVRSVNSSNLALLQYTSGSTTQARGVMIGHEQLIANQRCITSAFGHSADTVIAGWLPLHHDMGLIGNVLQALFVGAPSFLMSPAQFLNRPRLWLEAISRYGVTTSGGPSFGYEHCVARIQPEQCRGLDLSSWKVAFNGSEPVRAEVIDRFVERFAGCGFRREAFLPCYGLAEATLIVSGGGPRPRPTIHAYDSAGIGIGVARKADAGRPSVRLVSCGPPVDKHQVEIVDPSDGCCVTDGKIGEILVCGSSVARGYWRCRATESFTTQTAHFGGLPFLHTGDLGFLHNGELFITGRLKDTIIIRGRKVYPQDLEWTASHCDASLRLGGCAAFSVNDNETEAVVLVQELEFRRKPDPHVICERIRQAVTSEHGVPVTGVALIAAGSLPRTTSGKVRRIACKSLYANNELHKVGEWRVSNNPVAAGGNTQGAEGIHAWFMCQIASRLGIDQAAIDSRMSLRQLGLDSLACVNLAHALGSETGRPISAESFVDDTPLYRLISELGAPTQAQAISKTSELSIDIASCPLTPVQKAIWFQQQLFPTVPMYHVVRAAWIRGKVDPIALRRAVQHVVERHPALRLTFGANGGVPYQKLGQAHESCWRHEHWEQAEADDLLKRARGEAALPINLEAGPLFRVVLLEGRTDWLLLIAAHHLVVDLWSMDLILKDMQKIYADELLGTPAHTFMTEAPSFLEHALWKQSMLRGDTGRAMAERWRSSLAGASAVLALPADRQRPAIPNFQGDCISFHLPREITAILQLEAAKRQVTLYTLLLAGFAEALQAYSRSGEILVLSPLSGRLQSSWRNTVGCFVNPTVLRVPCAASQTWDERVRLAAKIVAGALRDQDFPTEPIAAQELMKVPAPRVLFALQSSGVGDNKLFNAWAAGLGGCTLPFGPATLESVELHLGTCQRDLALILSESAAGLEGFIEYSAELFERDTAELFAFNLRRTLEKIAGITSDSGRLRAKDITLARTEVDYGAACCIHDVIAATALLAPDRIAVCSEAGCLTYSSLQRRADDLALRLAALGVGFEDRVCVRLERSLELVIALLGVLNAGACYVPIDPSQPSSRQLQIASQAGAACIITDAAGEFPIEPTGLIAVAPQGAITSAATASRKSQASEPAGLMYVIFTSGSTGSPKGAMLAHAGVYNRLKWMQDRIRLEDSDRVMQKTPCGFDVSVWELFWPLMQGCTLVMAPPGAHREPFAIAELIWRERITTIHFVPSMLEAFMAVLSPRTLSALRRIICSGEALPYSLAQRCMQQTDAQLWNLYGPTEFSIDATAHLIKSEDPRHLVPIGLPIANTQAYILDSRGDHVPAGATGELCLGGIGLFRGYLDRPDLTADAVRPNPFDDRPGTRLYRTGDLVRQLPTGQLVYVGRLDDQVKILGHRVEPGEVQAALERLPGVRRAVVVARRVMDAAILQYVPQSESNHEGSFTPFRPFLAGALVRPRDPASTYRLDAFVICDDAAKLDTAGLIADLRRDFPPPMVPTTVTCLAALPLTPNGKLDNHLLIPADRPAASPAEPVVGSTELALARIWSKVLVVEAVGAEDNFFALGGDSLKAIQVVSAARDSGMLLTVQQVLGYPTVRSLARVVSCVTPDAPHPSDNAPAPPFALCSEEDSKLFPDGVEDAFPMATLQTGLVYHAEATPERPVYHDVFVYHLRGRFDQELFAKTVMNLMRRHPALRCSFDLATFSCPIQIVHRHVTPPIKVTDLRSTPPGQQASALWERVKSERHFRYLWDSPPFIRFNIHWIADDRFDLILSFHDALLDGWSTSLLVTEILEVYSDCLAGAGIPEQTLDRYYHEFIQAELAALSSAESAGFWRQSLSAHLPMTLQRWDREIIRSEEAGKEEGFTVFNVPLGQDLSDELIRYAAAEGVSIKHVLLAAHVWALAIATGRRDVVTGLESNGRLEAPEADCVVGLHLNTLPFAVRLDNWSLRQVVREVYAAEMRLLPHRWYPYAEIQKDTGGEPWFNTVFNYTHFHKFRRLRQLRSLEILAAEGYGASHFAFRAEFNQDPFTSRLQLCLEFDREVLPEIQIQTIAGYYVRALKAIARQPDISLGSIGLLAEDERRSALGESPDDNQAANEASATHLWIMGTAERLPDAVAVVHRDVHVTYAALMERARAQASRLRKRGAEADSIVAILLPCSADAVCAMIAALEAGAAYTILSPDWPAARIREHLCQSGASVVIAQADLGRQLLLPDRSILDPTERLAGEVTAIEEQGSTWRDRLAYVIFTSGSTGRPKGVMATHGNLAGSTMARHIFYGHSPSRFLLVSPLIFDSAVAGIYWTLTGGGTLILPEPSRELALNALATTIIEQRITHWLSVPRLYEALLEISGDCGFSTLGTVIVAGEACPPRLVALHRQSVPLAELVNEYGPTEATVWSTAWRAGTDFRQISVPIGAAVAHARAVILDPWGQPAATGVAGELYLGGEGIARGYVNQPDATADRFRPDPFSKKPNMRLYATGDRAVRTPDGLLYFRGRMDNELKINGHRIAPEEIENALRQHPAVADAAVLVRGMMASPQLVAHVQTKVAATVREEELHRWLRSLLPDPLVPRQFERCEQLPRMSTGKICRTTLQILDQQLVEARRLEKALERIDSLTDAEVSQWLTALESETGKAGAGKKEQQCIHF